MAAVIVVAIVGLGVLVMTSELLSRQPPSQQRDVVESVRGGTTPNEPDQTPIAAPGGDGDALTDQSGVDRSEGATVGSEEGPEAGVNDASVRGDDIRDASRPYRSWPSRKRRTNRGVHHRGDKNDARTTDEEFRPKAI